MNQQTNLTIKQEEIVKDKIINCQVVAGVLYEDIQKRLNLLKAKSIVPNFVTILVGENKASQIYVNRKEKKAKELGINNKIYRLEGSISQKELLAIIKSLNNDDGVDGVLIQMPLPKHIDSNAILLALDYKKDIDGLHPFNQGLMILERNRGYIDNNKSKGFLPCTPMGCMYALEKVLAQKNIDIVGKTAAIMGRSNLVGVPMMHLLLNNECATSIVHSKVNNIKEITKQADILVVAVGVPNLVDESYIKEGVIILDVGINSVDGKIVGDVNLARVLDKVEAISPVPKGVGPLTIASLMSNVVRAAELKINLK